MINPVIEFDLHFANQHFYAVGEERPVVNVEKATRFPTFSAATEHAKTFHKQNNQLGVVVRPVQIAILLLD